MLARCGVGAANLAICAQSGNGVSRDCAWRGAC
jgi:hypothetical protein